MEEKDFKDFVFDWWHEYLDNHKDQCKRLMEEFIGEEETIEDYLDKGETPYDWCYNNFISGSDATTIYETFFGYHATSELYNDMPDTVTFLQQMFEQAVPCELKDYSFTKEFIEDMAAESEGYTEPSGFFSDLQHGCQSGMIGMLIYNYDCKRIYIEHLDDMEEFKNELEDELGEGIRNKDGIHHYTFMCWLCYEELGFRVARVLFPNEF